MITVDGVSKIFHLSARPRLIREHVRQRFNKRYRHGDFYALRKVTFQVQATESVAVIGSNGAGKSTLLALIAGVARPDEGTVEVRGRVSALLELGSGFHPDLTGAENIYLNASLLGFTKVETKEAFPAIVQFAELDPFINEPLRTYSAGMTLRLGFSIAVHVNPDIILVDETLTVGDANFQAKCTERLRELRRAGKTFLITSHSPALLKELCTRAIWLDAGEIVMDGGVSEVVEAYTAWTFDPHRARPGIGVPARVKSL